MIRLELRLMNVLCSGSTQLSAHSQSIKDIWQSIWRLASRHITSPSTCKASCHLLAVLLQTQIVSYGEVEDLVDSMLAAIELNGPVECDEAAANLWRVILRLKAHENVGSTSEVSSVVLSWLFKRWDIGEQQVSPIIQGFRALMQWSR